LKQEELSIDGHAIEARLYAEDPNTGFLPSIGELRLLSLPYDARIESAVETGDEVSPFYDPMIAKIISVGADREEAVEALSDACAQVQCVGVRTNAGFLVRCLDERDFIAGNVDTSFIPSRGDALSKRPTAREELRNAAATAFIGAETADARNDTWKELVGFRLNAAPVSRVLMRQDGEAVSGVFQDAHHDYMAWPDRVVLFDEGEAYEFTLDTGEAAAGEAAAGDGAITSPMPGKIVSVAAKAGASLKKGDPILVLEAMKMEHTLTAPFDGVLSELNAKAGAQVSEGVLLAKLEKASS